MLEIPDKGGDSGRHLFLAIVNLIQDEEKDVRMETAAFLTDLLVEDTHGPRLDLMSADRCLEQLVVQIRRWFQPPNIVQSVLQLLANESLLLTDDGRDEPLLYEPEERNFFREQDECIPFFIRAVELSSPPPLTDEQVVRILDETNESLNHVSIKTRWLFLRPTEFHSILTKLSARLVIVSLCCPKWKSELRFQELQAKVQNF